MSGIEHPDTVFVVVGGYEFTPGMSHPATATVREIARRHRVLHVISEAHGSILRLGRLRQMGAVQTARTLLGSSRPRRVAERVWVAPVRGLAAVTPLSVPESLRRRNVRLITGVIQEWLQEVGADRCVLIFHWWALPELVETVPAIATAYDCSDEQAEMPGRIVPPDLVMELEGRLLDAVDVSYVVSEGLLDRRLAPGRNISVLPNGFDLRTFEAAERGGWVVPPRVRAVTGPVIGYVGTLSARIDWDLIETLSARRPDWSFVFVGGDPKVEAPLSLRMRPNVILHESVPYPEALGAVSRFDVGLIPVRVEIFTRGNSFLKLLDYFAHGLPVVAPPLPDTARVASHHPGMLSLASDVDEWEAAIGAALCEPEDAAVRDARRAYARGRSIEQRVGKIEREALTTHARAAC